ncbi:MAG: AraC family transcriptional regulator [Clostridiaceae bacterium]|nr:AraC family transcriptional regulator [Clostridiaceae bacterium]
MKVKKHTLRMRTTFILSLIAVLVIPFFSSAFIYRSAYKKLETEVLRNNAANLERFNYLMEERLKSSEDLLYLAAQNFSVDDLVMSDRLGEPMSQYSTLLAWQNLAHYRRDYMTDIFVCLWNNDRIVSSYNSVLSPQLYYQAYLSSAGDYDAWLTRIKGATYMDILPYKTSATESTLALCQPLPLTSYKQSNAAVVCVLSGNVLQGLMETFTGNDDTGAQIGLFDASGECLTATDEKLREMSLSSLEPGTRRETFDGEVYAVTVATSRYGRLRYVSVIPTATITRELTGFRYASILNAVLFFAFGLPLTWLLTKKNYAPVKRLLTSVSELTATRYDRGADELSYVGDAFERAVRKLEGSLVSARRAYLLELLNGVHLANAETFGQLSMRCDGLRFVVTLVRVDGWNREVIEDIYEGEPVTLVETIVGNILEELCGGNGYVTAVKRELFACVQSTLSEEAEEEAYALCTRAKRVFENDLGLHICAAVSNACRGANGVAECYMQACRALEYRLVEGSVVVLRYRITAVFRENTAYQETAGNLMMQCLKTPQASARATAEALLELYTGGQALTPEAVRRFAAITEDLLRKMSEEYALTGSMPALLSEPTDTLNTLIERCAYRLYTLQESYRSSRESDGYGGKIKRHIEENYTDITLGVNTIAYRFTLSPSYCSHVFRQETGMGINDCLLETRIKAASKLLIETDLPIETVAVETGFSGSSVFIRIFKKYRGVTPGTYRKSWGEEDAGEETGEAVALR